MTTYPQDVSRARSQVGLVAALALLGGVAPALSAASYDDFNETFDEGGYVPGGPNGLNDLRFGYSMLPAGAHVEILSGSITAPGNYDKETVWDKTGRVGMTWMTPLSELDEMGGFLLGLEASSNHYVIETSSKGPGIDMRALAFTIHPGLGWEFDPHHHMELGPFLGLGLATMEEDGVGSTQGYYFETGFRVAYFYTFSRWQIGANIFALFSSANGELSDGGYDYDVEIRTLGVGAGLQLGYRL